MFCSVFVAIPGDSVLPDFGASSCTGTSSRLYCRFIICLTNAAIVFVVSEVNRSCCVYRYILGNIFSSELFGELSYEWLLRENSFIYPFLGVKSQKPQQ